MINHLLGDGDASDEDERLGTAAKDIADALSRFAHCADELMAGILSNDIWEGRRGKWTRQIAQQIDAYAGQLTAMAREIIDFDEIDNWAAELTEALRPHLPCSIAQTLRSARPEFVEDARDLLFEVTDREAIIEATLTWIRSALIAGYHASRLLDEEIASIRTEGLVPLKAAARRGRLIRALSPHPRWNEVMDQLDATINDHGPRAAAGQREGQVHLTLSAAGLLDHFNHYLTHGAEFDQCVAETLLGPGGKELLARDGTATIIRVAVPGVLALETAHPHFGIEHVRARGDVPNVVSEFLEAWSYRLAYPEFQSRSLKVDCGMVFRAVVPAAWIVDIRTVESDTNDATGALTS